MNLSRRSIRWFLLINVLLVFIIGIIIAGVFGSRATAAAKARSSSQAVSTSSASSSPSTDFPSGGNPTSPIGAGALPGTSLSIVFNPITLLGTLFFQHDNNTIITLTYAFSPAQTLSIKSAFASTHLSPARNTSLASGIYPWDAESGGGHVTQMVYVAANGTFCDVYHDDRSGSDSEDAEGWIHGGLHSLNATIAGTRAVRSVQLGSASDAELKDASSAPATNKTTQRVALGYTLATIYGSGGGGRLYAGNSSGGMSVYAFNAADNKWLPAPEAEDNVGIAGIGGVAALVMAGDGSDASAPSSNARSEAGSSTSTVRRDDPTTPQYSVLLFGNDQDANLVIRAQHVNGSAGGDDGAGAWSSIGVCAASAEIRDGGTPVALAGANLFYTTRAGNLGVMKLDFEEKTTTANTRRAPKEEVGTMAKTHREPTRGNNNSDQSATKQPSIDRLNVRATADASSICKAPSKALDQVSPLWQGSSAIAATLAGEDGFMIVVYQTNASSISWNVLSHKDGGEATLQTKGSFVFDTRTAQWKDGG